MTENDMYIDHCDVCQRDMEWNRLTKGWEMFGCVGCEATTEERHLQANTGPVRTKKNE